MQLPHGIEDVRRRASRVVARAGGNAVDNALSAAQSLATQIAQRRALAPVDAGGPGELAGLSRPECLQLLATRQVGRVAYVARAGLPDIVPVNYELDGENVLVRSGPGPKLQAAERGDMVAFEVDDIDEEQHTGWSVVVVGRAHRLSAAEQNRVELVPKPWAVGPRLLLMRITPTRITGRRLD